MKFASLNVATIAAALLTRSVYAGFPDGEDGNPSQILGHELGADQGSGRELSDEDLVSVLVQYRDEEGYALTNMLAIEEHGTDISRKHHTEVITTQRRNIATLANNEHIVAAEIDEPMFALPYIRTNVAGTGEEVRRLQGEETPYGITMINPIPQGNHPIKVCVVDTGYDINHPDLPTLDQNTDGFSPYGDSELWHVDGHGHGTHCAGTIGAVGGNGIGVTSVNPDESKFSFFIGKGLTNTGSGSSSGVLQAVEKCVEAGANVISMSLGGGGFSEITENTYKDIYDGGVLVVAAAGNSGNSAYSYPASYKYVMSVAAVDSSKNKASFSQYNDQVEIAAPGVSVKSTLPSNSYASWSGTSMACPHVAGVAALVWSHFPDCSNKHIRQALIASAEDRGAGGCDTLYGHGIVNAKGAFDYLTQKGCNFQVGEAVGGCNQFFDPPPTVTPAPQPVTTPLPTPSPVTTPAVAPVSPPSSPVPCIGIRIEIATDSVSTEVSWSIKDFLKPFGDEITSGTGYTEHQASYSQSECLEAGVYTFSINDASGSTGTGTYKLSLVGTGKVFIEGQLDGSGDHVFGFVDEDTVHVVDSCSSKVLGGL